MDIEKEIQNIISKKEGNTEIAFFSCGSIWQFHLGNTSNSVNIGELDGEIVTSGKSIEDVVIKMKQKIGI